MALQLTVVTPERRVLETEADEIEMPGAQGYLGILPGHAPLITLLGLSLPELVAGAIVTEQIFSWNGLGQLIVTSAGKRDTPVVLALTLISGTAIIIGNLVADIGYRIVDPRIKLL